MGVGVGAGSSSISVAGGPVISVMGSIGATSVLMSTLGTGAVVAEGVGVAVSSMRVRDGSPS